MIPAHPALLQCLVHLAWCDGQISEAERLFLRDVLTKVGLSIEEQDALLETSQPMPKDTDLAAACPDLGTRRQFLKIANQLTQLSTNLNDEEWTALKTVCHAFAMRRIRHWQDLQTWLC